jgi:hypothetical protein
MDDKSPEHQSLARILVDKGLLSQSQITSVLEYQCRLPPGQYMSFTDIVVAFEYLTEAALVDLLGDHYYIMKDPISQILVEQGLVSHEQLEQALTVLDTFSREHVAEVLIDLGFATPQTIEQAISKHQLAQSQQLKAPDDSQLKSRLAKAFAQQDPVELLSPVTDPDAELSIKQEESISFTQKPAENVHLPLGRKLIAAGHLTESELQDALDYQQRLPHVMHKPLGKILVEMGYLSEALLEAALAQEQTLSQPPPQRIGDILTQAGVVEAWQLAHALRLQFTPAHANQRLGEILVNMGYATREKIETALSAHYHQNQLGQLGQQAAPVSLPSVTPDQEPVAVSELESQFSAKAVHRPIGQLLVEREYINAEQLQAALLIQKELADAYTPLGDILVMQGHLTEAQLQEVLAAQERFQRKPLGQVLVDMGFLEEWQLSYALCVQHSAPPEKRVLLGDVLLAMHYITPEQLQIALSEQQN